MKKNTYLNALEKVKCSDDFRKKTEKMLMEDSDKFSDSVNHVEVLYHRHRFSRIFTGALTCAVIFSVVGISYKMLENTPDIPEETVSESSDLQSNSDLIETDFGFETSFDFEVFHITDDERSQIAELLRNYNDYTETESPDDERDYIYNSSGDRVFNFSYMGGNAYIKIYPDGRLCYSEDGNNENIYAVDYNYFRNQIYKILNINNFDNFVYALSSIAEPPAKIELNGEELEGERYKSFNDFIATNTIEWAVMANLPDMSSAEVVNEMKVYSSGAVHIVREYDNGYIETSNGNESEVVYYRSRFFENIESILNTSVSEIPPFGDFSELRYNFGFFDITDDERQKLSELFSSYKWVETDDDSWSIQRYGETNSEFKFYLYDENNRFITFMEKGFLIYQYSEDSDYLTKAYKIDYNYFKDEIYKILNIREIKNFAVLDDTDKVAEITCNGVLLEGKEKDALIEWLAISVSDFAEVINVPDLSTAKITKEIEYTDVQGINHNFTAYDSGYADIDGKYYRSNALDFTIEMAVEDYDGFQMESGAVSVKDGKLKNIPDTLSVSTKANFKRAMRRAKENYENKYYSNKIDVEYYTDNFDTLTEQEKKVFVYHMMINSIDYYDTAEGKIKYNTADGNFGIEYNMNVSENYYHWINTDSEGRENNEYYIYDGKSYTVNPVQKSYSVKDSEEINDYTMLDCDRMVITDGQNQICYREHNMGVCGDKSLFPQIYAFRYLRNFKLWDIIGTESYADRECIVIEGSITDNESNKWFGERVDNFNLYANSTSFKMYIDKYTGILLAYSFSDKNGLTSYMETEYINIDSPVECEKFNPDGYTDYTD